MTDAKKEILTNTISSYIVDLVQHKKEPCSANEPCAECQLSAVVGETAFGTFKHSLLIDIHTLREGLAFEMGMMFFIAGMKYAEALKEVNTLEEEFWKWQLP